MEPSTPAAFGGADNTSPVRPSIPLAEFLQALEAYPQPTRRNPCHRLPARQAVCFMLTGKADEWAGEWLEKNGHSPDYRLSLYDKDGEPVPVDAESLHGGADLPENVFVRLSDVALFFLHKSGSGWLFVDVPWSDSEGQPCLVENPEEAVKIDAHYIDYPEAETILARVLKDDPPGEEEIVFWLATGELTAWRHEHANAGKVDCSKTFTVMTEGLGTWKLPVKPSCLDRIAQQIENFYFSRQQLETFRPATRWRSYDYVLALGKQYGVDKTRLNRLIWHSPQSQLRDFYLIEAPPFHGPDSQEALQPVEPYIKEHFYPSGWIKPLEDKLAQRRAQLSQEPEKVEASAEEDHAEKTVDYCCDFVLFSCKRELENDKSRLAKDLAGDLEAIHKRYAGLDALLRTEDFLSGQIADYADKNVECSKEILEVLRGLRKAAESEMGQSEFIEAWIDAQKRRNPSKEYSVEAYYDVIQPANGQRDEAQSEGQDLPFHAQAEAAQEGFKPAGFSIPATPYGYDQALKQDAWAVWEALCWLHGDDPMYYRGNIESDYRIEVGFVRRAVKAGTLTPEGSSPRQWIEWAASKGWAVPERLRLFVEAQPCPTQETPKPEPSTASDPRRFYHQAFGTRVTVAEMRERWGHSNNKYLDELARLGELIPWHGREGIAIYTRPKGLGCQFGIPPDTQWSDKGSVVFDAGEMVWTDTLPDDAYYGLPFVLEYEEKNPHLKQKAEPASISNQAEKGSGQKEKRCSELRQWMRRTWVSEGKPGGTKFFNALERHRKQKGSPIKEWYFAGKSAGIDWEVSGGASGSWSKHTIQTLVSEFKKEDKSGCQAK